MSRIIRKICSVTAAGAGLVISIGTPARAQGLTVDPGGTIAEPAPAPAAPAEPVVIQMPVQGNQFTGESNPSGDQGFYYDGDYADSFGDDDFEGRRGVMGPVPSFHVVRRGDTLWDICWFYFNNPWEWPKIWSYNPVITNPHWIYPGDLVRLYPRGLSSEPVTPVDPETPPQDEGGDIQPTPAQRYGVSLRQLAFVEREDLEVAATIAGAVEEKSLLSRGDSVYLSYPDGQPPKVGKRYTIYNQTREVKHPGTGKVIGAYVKILGELQVESVKKDKLARAVITDSVDVIERGDRVGPLQRTYRTVEPRRNETDLQGTIVAIIDRDQLIGQGQIIFIDKGEASGVKVGNRMYVVRRGDAYGEIMNPDYNVGQDDRRFPARAIGEILVVQAGKKASVALVTLALQEIGIGDLVLMRKARE